MGQSQGFDYLFSLSDQLDPVSLRGIKIEFLIRRTNLYITLSPLKAEILSLNKAKEVLNAWMLETKSVDIQGFQRTISSQVGSSNRHPHATVEVLGDFKWFSSSENEKYEKTEFRMTVNAKKCVWARFDVARFACVIRLKENTVNYYGIFFIDNSATIDKSFFIELVRPEYLIFYPNPTRFSRDDMQNVEELKTSLEISLQQNGWLTGFVEERHSE